MRRRTFLAAAAAAGATGLAGCESAEVGTTEGIEATTAAEPTETGTPSPTPTATPTPTAPPQPEPIEFETEGDAATDAFGLAELMTEVSFQHSGTGEFVVDLVDPDGDVDDYRVVEGEGLVSGVRGRGFPDGEYVLDVRADGTWVVTIRQHRVLPSDGAVPPVEIEGDAYGDVSLVQVDGSAAVTVDHTGDGRFRAESYDRTGGHVDTLFNKLGSFEDETTLEREGATWLTVEATDDWDLTVTAD